MVTRFLVSGTNEQLIAFHRAACMTLNAIEQRGQTIFYTCMGEDRDHALNVGRDAGVTMQEMDNDPGRELWTVVVPGDHPGWKPPSNNALNADAESAGPQPVCASCGKPGVIGLCRECSTA